MQANQLKHVGKRNAPLCFYLPNAPTLLPERLKGQADVEITAADVEEIIRLNGNHWRKIFVIMAKISAPDLNWRDYLPQLLSANEQLYFGANQLASIDSVSPVHIVCGGESCDALGLTKAKPQAFSVYEKQKGVVMTTPYLDYRQFPNRLVDQLRQTLKQLNRISSV